MPQDNFDKQYQKLQQILNWFDGDEFDLAKAEGKIDEGMKLAETLLKRLESAKLNVRKLEEKLK